MAERFESGGVRYGAWRYEIYQGIFLDGISDAGLYRCVADDDDALCVSSDIWKSEGTFRNQYFYYDNDVLQCGNHSELPADEEPEPFEQSARSDYSELFERL